jgi:hypothetical protein
VNENTHLKASFLAAAGLLLAGLCALWWSVNRTGRTLTYEFVPRRVHWVQMIMHSSVYAYWGWYWREVYHEIPLILAQIVLLYVLDMLVCWARRDKWILGFGQIPIIFSMNLFLWFRDDWFFLQLLLIVTAVLGKEFIRWKRDGHLTHIFNPSAFGPFVFVIGLVATKSTTYVSLGEQVATTIAGPQHMYVLIFLVGLVAQSLFSVTLVTLSAVAVLATLSLLYTRVTGVYYFIDSNIPTSVFLGMHLLVTDPATSPRRPLGKVLFGGLYGAGVFAVYAILGWIDGPQFYDKLLCVPPLARNQSIQMESAVNPIRMVLNGGFPPGTEGNPMPYGMPPFAQSLSDNEVAAVVTYIRTAWGNHGNPVTSMQANQLRSAPLY